MTFMHIFVMASVYFVIYSIVGFILSRDYNTKVD